MVDYNPIDYSRDYLTFVAEEDGTFKFTGNSINYSLDNGETWTTLESDIDSPTVQVGNKIMFKATLIPQEYSGIGTFSSTCRFTAQGNVMSLLYGDDFIGKKDLTGKDYVFYGLFNGCTGLTNAKNLCLPATTLTTNCYRSMFYGCTSLTNAPELPATTLASYCYSNMFQGCTSLINAPELPVTTLADYCYEYMFQSCTALTNAPELPATTLTTNCYRSMFYNCTSLTNAPELPATTLTNGCYSYMFYNCKSLTNAPELPVTTLVDYCYRYMFYGCNKLNYIKMLATDISATNCLNSWVYGVSSTGTFVKHPNMASLPTGVSGIPNGWTVQDAA